MDFFEVVRKRRSIRRFTDKKIPNEVMEKSLDAAVLAPNSSNTQTWNFYWVQSPDPKEKLVQYCLSQSAARTAQELIVVSADPSLWKRSQPLLVNYVEGIRAPKSVKDYYTKLVPMMYTWGFLNILAPFKWLLINIVGLFRPIVRGPYTKKDLQLTAIKSAALAAENFVLAMAAQGYQTCMMEGFDEMRVKRLLKMKCSEKVVMVIGCGEESAKGTWGPQFRIPSDFVIKKI